MCIRDRGWAEPRALQVQAREEPVVAQVGQTGKLIGQDGDCLLYTSDAADERSSVDLGGRRIIKKKNRRSTWRRSTVTVKTRDNE